MLCSTTPIMADAQPTQCDQIYIEDFQTEKCESLFKFKNENLFTDVFIYVEGVEFPCHKVILCASSQYFQAMFSCDLKESRHGKVFIENMSPWTMKRLLDFIYTGKIEISYENVIDLFNAAVLFQLSKLVDKCISYVKKNVDLSNCVEIYLFGSMHGLKDLQAYTYQFILENFRLLIDLTIDLYSKLNSNDQSACDNLFNQLKTKPLSNLSIEQIKDKFYSSFIRLDQKTFCSLLQSDQLNVKREIYVYYCIMKWLEYQSQTGDQNDLFKLHEQLFRYLRLNSLSKDELEFILENDKILEKNLKLKQKIEFTLGDLESSQDANIRPSTLPKDYICSLDMDNFDLYDINNLKWDRLVNWPPDELKSQHEFTKQKFDGYSVCTVNNVLYVIGGMRKKMDHIELKSCVYRFDPVKNEWSSLSAMKTKRAFHHTIHLSKSKEENFILVLYGIKYEQEELEEQSFQQSMTIEMYSIENDKWKEMNIEYNSILNHHLFSFYHLNNAVDLDLPSLIKIQIEQSKLVVGLKNLIYILNDNCIHCFEFEKQNVNSYLPYFRLPKNLTGFVLARAVSFKTANILTQFDMDNSNKKSLFSWYSDTEEKSPSMSSTSSNSLQSPTIHDYDEDGSCKRVLIRHEKEALMFILNPDQGLLYEFYPGKNKLLRMPNLILKHDKYATFVFKIKSRVVVTGGIGDEEGFYEIESYDRDTHQWSILTKYPISMDKSDQSQIIRSFFRLKMSLV